MGMVVRTNMTAINSNNALTRNNSTVSKSVEKLSTGMKINRAADDASGLAISEKMKAQIKSLDTASSNAEDGISLIQTSEGYMGEVHDMLNRIVELAEKSANGTYETKSVADGGAGAEVFGDAGTDRQSLQDEVNQLSSEIDRIATTANFNNLKLMDGTLAEKSNYKVSDMSADNYVWNKVAADAGNTMEAGTATTADSWTKSGKHVASGTISNETTYKADAFVKLSDGYKISSSDTGVTKFTASAAEQQDIDGNNRLINDINSKGLTILSAQPTGTNDATAVTATGSSGGGLKLQIGETSTKSDKLTVNVMSFKTNDLFASVGTYKNADGTSATDKLTQSNKTSENSNGLTINVSNQDSASMSAEAVRDVIDKVSAQRGVLGAQQNRLEHTINNLTTASENTSSANSRIRDTDMAKEMMKYTQSNVLTQAAQAMLAQANQAPSQVLQLLQ